jgi:signal transduction histidine kinase
LWPCCVDATQLETALLNLALNGRDAMPDGGALKIAAWNVAVDAGTPPHDGGFVAAINLLEPSASPRWHLSESVAPAASIDRRLGCAMIFENTTGGQCHD